MSITFYGKIDRNKAGKISSSIPAWAMTTHKENMREEIAARRRKLERGEVPLDRVMEFKAEIEKDEAKFADIENSKPKLNPTEEKQVEDAYTLLGSAIANAKFSREDMRTGRADAHEEARRISQPCIRINSGIADICKNNNIRVTENKDGLLVNRRDAELAYKLCGHYMGAETNTEWLRKDQHTARTTTIRPKYYDAIGVQEVKKPIQEPVVVVNTENVKKPGRPKKVE
jgi:hypothetical protein